MKVIEIGDNKSLPQNIKSFQTTIGLPCIHYLKRLIKNNHTIEFKLFNGIGGLYVLLIGRLK